LFTQITGLFLLDFGRNAGNLYVGERNKKCQRNLGFTMVFYYKSYMNVVTSNNMTSKTRRNGDKSEAR